MAVYNFCLTAAAVAVRMGVCEAEETLSSAANLLCELRRRISLNVIFFFWPDLKTLKSVSFFFKSLNTF